ncbi:MAG: PqiC family protein [Akkermansiaceae bacterium]
MKLILPALLFPLLVASCGSILQPVEDTSVHHLLDPVVPVRKITGTSPSVAIASPALPSYLDRSQLVSRTGTGELQMNTFHLWGESLDSGISRVTALNLGRLKNSLNIQPVRNFVTLDYQTLLELRISRFEPDPFGRIVLDATWKLQPVEGPVARTRAFTTIVPILGPPLSPTDPQTGRIAAMNEALARLAREIACAL